VGKSWIDKGLPTRQVTPEENNIRVDMGMVARTTFDPSLLERIRAIESLQTKMRVSKK
jgi:hypothetical protein